LSLRAHRENLVTGGCASSIPGQALLARLQELFAPAVVEALRNTLLAAQLSNAVSPLKPLRTMRILSSVE
jgi:hypothetical protein